MTTKFFNNTPANTLFEKLKGIANNMNGFHRFLAVVGYFRSSGYFKLRKELGDVSDIRILVGINADDIFRKHNFAWEMIESPERAKELYNEQFKQDILDSNYSKEVEEGIFQLCQDLADGRLQLRLHPSKNLHAKFYLCLPENHTEHTDGWVIMGSSNISDSGLGTGKAPRYELNVAMKDYDDVHYCHQEFEILWNEAVPLSLDEVILKVCNDTFNNQNIFDSTNKETIFRNKFYHMVSIKEQIICLAEEIDLLNPKKQN